jgi:hypothetical protein
MLFHRCNMLLVLHGLKSISSVMWERIPVFHPPHTHCVENWLQSGVSLGKTHYHLTERWLTPGYACSWMDLALPIIHLVTTLRCSKIFQALQYKCQTFYYFYTPLHCKVHLTVLRVFLLGDPCWPFAPEQQNCEKC